MSPSADITVHTDRVTHRIDAQLGVNL